jgi:serine/threonine protein kinase
MVDQSDRVRFGPYQLVRELSPSPMGRRWLALRESDQSSHAVYQFEALPARAGRRRHMRAMHTLAGLRHPHLLAVELCSFEVGDEPWVVAPYTGNHDCIVTLADVLAAKGESLSAAEAERAVLQVLEGVGYAHSMGVGNGPLGMESLLVDRRGSVLIELYGVGRALRGLEGINSELVRDEVRSVVEIAYRLVTGLPAEEPRIPAGRLVKRLPRAFEEWLEEGLHPGGGFASAGEAIAMLPHRRPEVEPSRVRTVLGKLTAWSR